MTVPWLKRLRKLAQGKEWVKGAVNYDEDLHFSTYYLRASCSHFTAPLYPGYSSVVACYEGFNETYYLLKDECRESAAAIVNRALRKPDWLPRILCEIRRRSDALSGIFPPEISPALLVRLSNSGLLSLYRRHDKRHRALYKYARLPEALDRGVSFFTDYLLEHLRTHGLARSACTEAFGILCQSEEPSVLAQEMLEFDDIVRYARSHPTTVARSADCPARARMDLDPELRRRLNAHQEKWQFLPYHGYGRRELATLDHYLDRLLEQTRNPGALLDGSGLLARCKKARRARQQLLQRLKIDGPHGALFELYPEIGAVKLYRRYVQLRNFHALDMMLAEIARRLDVSEWTVRCMLPEEIMDSLRSCRLVRPAIHERTGGCVYVVVGGDEHVVGGEQATELRELFQPKSHAERERKVLHGVMASPGKAAGPCKVIIRANDCRAGFEKGMIVVSESTDPDLVQFLRAAGGVLTEQGGVTSHAAIICRELGVPTIIGIEGLLARVRDGDWLEMDAERGTVAVAGARVRPGTRAATVPDSPTVVGAKAYNLGVVRSMGFRVPDYVLLDYEEAQRVARRPEGGPSRRIVRRVIAQLGLSNGDKLALRSSAVTEDRADGSAAGEYRSMLNVGRDQVAASLRDFVNSNRVNRSGMAYRGSVIVQRMVQADFAGVCLTREARTGHGDAVILEMTAGGNAGVTGGTVRPDRVVVDRLTGDILHEERRCAKLLGRAIDVAEMVQQFLTLETRFGKPLDIEWARAGRDLYVLQARPIVVESQKQLSRRNRDSTVKNPAS
jgi:phosphohistidine swiveling domain-containing protein